MAGTLRTGLMFLFMIGLFMIIGWVVGGAFSDSPMTAALVFFGISMLFNLVVYFKCDKMVLSAYKVQLVSKSEAPRLYRCVEEITSSAGLPMPRIGIIPSSSPNAFATGRNPQHAVVCVTRGLLEILDDRELSGVLAHELGHVKNRDILVQTLAAAMAGAIMFLARIAYWGGLVFGGDRGRENLVGLIAAAVFAPIAALLIQLGISRAREYKADATGALLVRDPEALARALEKLEAGSRLRPMKGTQHTAHMFIVNPLRGGGLAGLFSTHPPIHKRIERLRKMKL